MCPYVSKLCSFLAQPFLESVKNASGPLLLEIVKQQGIDIGITLHHSDAGPKRSIIVERVTPASIADR